MKYEQMSVVLYKNIIGYSKYNKTKRNDNSKL